MTDFPPRLSVARKLLLCSLLGVLLCAPAGRAQEEATDGPAESTTPDSTAVASQPDNETSSENAPPVSAAATPSIAPITTVIPALPKDVASSFISYLNVVGRVVEDRALLAVEIRVSVTRPGVWEEIPLRLSESRIRGVTYAGPGLHSPVVDGDRGEGLTWKFFGQGEHTLALDVDVSTERVGDQASLTLSLPKLHRLFSSEVELRLPGGDLVVEADGADLATTPLPDNETLATITLRGTGDNAARSNLVVRWGPPAVVKPGAIERADTTMTFSVDETQGIQRLTVEQQYTAVDQNLTSVRVRVPEQFPERYLVLIEGDRYVDRRATTTSDGDEALTVFLRDSPAREAQLRWVFERPLVEEEASTVVSGFDVLDAESHSGRLALIESEGYRVAIDWENASGARRAAASADGEIAVAAISQFPFEIPLRIRKERASITVAPTSDLTVTESDVRLRATFDVEVDRGRVDELTGEWGGQAWNDLQVASPVDARLTTTSRGFVVSLASPRDGDFSVVLIATDSDPKTRRFGLPRLLAENEAPTSLRVYAADSVDVDVTARGEARLMPLAAPVTAPPPPEAVDCQLATQQRVIGEPAVVEVARQLREAKKTATGLITLRTNRLADSEEFSAQFSQEIDLIVSHGRTREVRLLLPGAATSVADVEAFASLYRFRVNGQPVPRERVSVDTSGRIRIDFESALKRCLLVIETAAITFGRDDQSVDVPVLSIDGVAFESLLCQVERNQIVGLLPKSTPRLNWRESPVTAINLRSWVAAEPVLTENVIGFSTTYDVARSDAVYGVTRFDTTVAVSPTAAAVESRIGIRDAAGAVVIGLPPSAEALKVSWNGDVVATKPSRGSNGERRAAGPDDDPRLTLLVPTGDATDGELQVSYRLSGGSAGFGTRQNADLVQLPTSGVWYECTPAIQLSLPTDRFLLHRPRNVEVGYHWGRTGLFWSRVSARQLPRSGSETAPGRSYLFESAEPPRAISFRTVDGSAFVFAGSMLTFCVAFLMRRVPSLRSLPALLTIAAIIVAVGVVDAELLRLSFQPALLGAAFALVASTVDASRSRRAGGGAPILTVVSESEYSLADDRSGSVVVRSADSKISVAKSDHIVPTEQPS